MQIRLDLEPPAYDRLVDVALAEHRPLAWQAEVLLRRALGLTDADPLPEHVTNRCDEAPNRETAVTAR